MDIIKITDQVVIQGEARWLKFTYTDENGDAISMPDGGYTFIIKNPGDDAALFTAGEADFDLTQRTSGIIKVNLPADETVNFPVGKNYGQMTAVMNLNVDVDIQKVRFKVEAPL